ncbi:MAG: DUF4139 domain-containing protein [Desulfovibrio sp.]
MKKFAAVLMVVAFLTICGEGSRAQADDKTPDSVCITAYSSGQALITEVRSMELPASGEVAFPGAPDTLDLTSVALEPLDQPEKVAVGSLRLLPSASNPSAVLSNFIGREVKVVLPDPSDARGRVTRRATLLSAGSQAVLDLGEAIYVGPLEAVLLPSGEDKPRAEAALFFNVRNQGRASQRMELSYLAGGLQWSGDCALTLDEAGEQGALSCWATLRNDTGRSFAGAQLRLVAGEVNRVARPAMARFKGAGVLMEESMDMVATEQSVGEYHLFTVPFPATLMAGQVTRLSLAQADNVRVGRELLVRGHAFQGTGGAEPERRPVEIVLVLENTQEQGLGRPLPASRVRVYRDVAGGGKILEGEASLGNLAAGETARLGLGTSFDVTARRTMLSYEKLGKNRSRVNWAVELRNAGKKAQSVMVLETMQGDWKITESSFEYAKVSADTARWVVQVPAGGKPVTLRYEAETAW